MNNKKISNKLNLLKNNMKVMNNKKISNKLNLLKNNMKVKLVNYKTNYKINKITKTRNKIMIIRRNIMNLKNKM